MLPPEFKTVKQPKGSKVCGAAVVAMVTGCTLEEAESQMVSTPSEDGQPYYRTREVLKAIGANGVFAGMVGFVEDDTFELDPDMDIEFVVNMRNRPAVLVVKSKRLKGYSHFVLWDGENVRDSSSDDEVNTLDQYEIQEVWPLTYLDEGDA